MRDFLAKFGFPALSIMFLVLIGFSGSDLFDGIARMKDRINADRVATSIQLASDALGPLPRPIPRRAGTHLEDGVELTWLVRVDVRTTLICALDNTLDVSWRIDRLLPGQVSSAFTVTNAEAQAPEITDYCNGVFPG